MAEGVPVQQLGLQELNTVKEQLDGEIKQLNASLTQLTLAGNKYRFSEEAANSAWAADSSAWAADSSTRLLPSRSSEALTLPVDRRCYAVSRGSGRSCAVTVPGDRACPPTPC